MRPALQSSSGQLVSRDQRAISSTRAIAPLRRGVLPLAALALGATALALPSSLSPELGRSARQKVERIEKGETMPGEAVVFTEAEVNSLLKYEYEAETPAGVRDLSVRLFQDHATLHASIDIGKMQQAAGRPAEGLWALLFSGERELNAKFRLRSADGRAFVEIESVQFGDTILPGALLDWLIAATISDTDPGSGPANRVSLPETIRAVHLEPERAVVVIN